MYRTRHFIFYTKFTPTLINFIDFLAFFPKSLNYLSLGFIDFC